MKKLVVALLLAAMTMTAVTGCGNGGAGASNNASEPAAPADTSSGSEAAPADKAASGETQDITLKVWCPQNQVDTGIMEQ